MVRIGAALRRSTTAVVGRLYNLRKELRSQTETEVKSDG